MALAELEGFEGGFGGGAFRGFLGTTATAGNFLFEDGNGAGIMAVVLGALRVELAIVGCVSVVFALSEFLEAGLRVAGLQRVGVLKGF